MLNLTLFANVCALCRRFPVKASIGVYICSFSYSWTSSDITWCKSYVPCLGWSLAEKYVLVFDGFHAMFWLLCSPPYTWGCSAHPLAFSHILDHRLLLGRGAISENPCIMHFPKRACVHIYKSQIMSGNSLQNKRKVIFPVVVVKTPICMDIIAFEKKE